MHRFPFLTSLAVVASLVFSPFSFGGEVKKTPLKMEEAVQLLEQQREDFKTIENTEAGRRKGSGLLGIALAVAATYYIVENVDKDDVKEKLGIDKD